MRQNWENRYQSLRPVAMRAEAAVEKGTAYLYRVGGYYFEAGFAAFLLGYPDWEALLHRAVELFDQSVKNQDCKIKDPRFFPYNLIQLFTKWYLACWLLNGEERDDLLKEAINLNVEVLWSKDQRPIEAFTSLAMKYLCRGDQEHLNKLWEFLAPRTPPQKFPSELGYWYQLSQVYLVENKEAAFWEAHNQYLKTLKDSSDEMATFFLAAAMIAVSRFKLSQPVRELLNRMTLE